VTGDWRNMHVEVLHDLYFASHASGVFRTRIMRWMGHVVGMVEKRNVFRVLVWNLQGQRLLGRPGGRWEDNIKVVIS
jgi:hypothetical protein